MEEMIKHHRLRGVIKPLILVHISMKNLFFKKLRTSLTVLGVVIGVGSIVFLVSLGLGLQKLVNRQVVGSNSVKTIDVSSTKSKVIKLDPETVKSIASLSEVEKVAKVYNFGGRANIGTSKTDSIVFGVDSDYLELGNLKVVEGSGQTLGDGQALVNLSLLKAVGISDAKSALQKDLNVNVEIVDDTKAGAKKNITLSAQIVGVIESGSGAEVYLDSKGFLASGVVNASQLKVLAKSQQSVPELKKQIEAFGLTSSSPLDTLDQINQIFNLFNFILVGFGGIGMIIAVLGMFNTLTISLLERTREIGLMISLGARQRDVRRLFIMESIALSHLGGLIGLIGAYMSGRVVDLVLNSWAASRGVPDRITAFDLQPWIIAATFVFVTIVGFVVVYFPARRASHINPIEALRHE